MKSFFNYVDLPNVPEYLLESIDSIINKPNSEFSSVPKGYAYFHTKPISNELLVWIETVFDRKVHAGYQIIKEGIHIHKDYGRLVAFNYLLQTGGSNVSTNIYDEDKNLIHSEIIMPKKWHCLKTDVFHDVRGMSTERIALSIALDDYIWGTSWSK
jgi:hypothetical protein